MKHRNSHLLIGYWGRIRAGRDVPDQSDIDPRAIKRILSQVFILDARDPARPIYRLAGTAVCDQFGLELRGTNFLAYWEAQAQQRLVLLLRQSLAMNQPVWLSAISTAPLSGMVERETVLAPLTFGSGAAQRFLGIAHALRDTPQPIGRAIARERLIDFGLANETDPRGHSAAPLPPPFPVGAVRKAPHLRLVVSRG